MAPELKPPAHHMGTAVADMEGMLEFYCDVLGFEVEVRAHQEEMTDEQFENARTLVDVPDGVFDVAFLDTPECNVELLHFENPEAKENVNSGSNSDVGTHHFAFEVESAAEWYDYMSDVDEPDFEIISPPQDIGLTPRFWVYDPEDNVVEIIQEGQGE
jgi:catechol 2,3-dioxygenase-like lactoylglutathione lyase family enzyme